MNHYISLATCNTRVCVHKDSQGKEFLLVMCSCPLKTKEKIRVKMTVLKHLIKQELIRSGRTLLRMKSFFIRAEND